MTKTILQMLANSRNKLYYILIITIPLIILNIDLYQNPLNFTILMITNFVALFSAIIISYEVLVQEERTKLYTYLKTLKSENYVLIYRTKSIYIISCYLVIPINLILNICYYKVSYPNQQFIYVLLILIGNIFYIYFLQYAAINIKNTLFRNSVVLGVTFIAMSALLTRSITTFLMYITMTCLFFAVTCMNRRLLEEIKRQDKNKK